MRGQRSKKKVDETQPIYVAEPITGEAVPRERSITWRRILIILLVIVGAIAILALSVGLGGYSGLYQGEEDRHQARLTEANEHYLKGESLLTQNQYKLAVAEFQ